VVAGLLSLLVALPEPVYVLLLWVVPAAGRVSVDDLRALPEAWPDWVELLPVPAAVLSPHLETLLAAPAFRSGLVAPEALLLLSVFAVWLMLDALSG